MLAKTQGKLQTKFQLLFDVYSPDKSFKKSQPGKPLYQVFTSSEPFDELFWPSASDFVLNDPSDPGTPEKGTSTTRPLYLYAFVDNGDVLFYSFDADFSLPCIFNTYFDGGE